jgi:hypothetical protein
MSDTISATTTTGTLPDTIMRGIRDATGSLQPFTGKDDFGATFDLRLDVMAETTTAGPTTVSLPRRRPRRA